MGVERLARAEKRRLLIERLTCLLDEGGGDADCFFFFSSRRRHTRFDCDWSSDVCCSDLVAGAGDAPGPAGVIAVSKPGLPIARSEERRVWSENRYRRHRSGSQKNAKR